MDQAIAVDSFFIELDDTNQVFIINGSGNVDYEKTVEAIQHAIETIKDNPDYKILALMDQVTYHPTFNEIMNIKNQITGLKNLLSNRVAIVTQGRLTIIADMICAFASLSSIKMKSFQSEEEAFNWLMK
jgi:predicted Zn-dependent peptidase